MTPEEEDAVWDRLQLECEEKEKQYNLKKQEQQKQRELEKLLSKKNLNGKTLLSTLMFIGILNL